MRPWRGSLITHIPLRKLWEKFHGMTRFTIADFNKGYWMVELDPESRKYTKMASRHWEVSVDLTSNGFHCCTRCVPKEIRCNFL